MKILVRLALGLAAALCSFPAFSDIVLPVLPTGGTMLVTFSLSQAGLSPLPNIPISLRVNNGCGTIGGSSQAEVTTNAQGVVSFSFTAGSVTGRCVIVGSNGPYSAVATTWIYREQDAAITVRDNRSVIQTRPGGGAIFDFKAQANGIALYGLPVSIGALPTQGTSAVVNRVDPTTASDGSFSLVLMTNSTTGYFDLTIRAGTYSRVVRVFVTPNGSSLEATWIPDAGARSGTALGSVLSVPRARISILEGPASCVLTYGKISVDSVPWYGPQQGRTEFPLGTFDLAVMNCPAATFAIDYDTPLPQDGTCVTATLGTSVTLPCSVNGNRVTIRLVGGGPGTQGLASDFQAPGIGVAKPGILPVAQAHPEVTGVWWSGVAENGWGMSLVKGSTNNLFGAIYAYDADGNPTWWVIPGGYWDGRHTTFRASIYDDIGTPWYAYNANLTTAFVAGDSMLQFPDADNAVFDYVINGVRGHKVIERQRYGVPGDTPLSNVGGMWYGGDAASGWGFAVMQQQSTLFSVWYTYDARNLPIWYVMPGGRWADANSYEGRIYRTRGSPWLGRTYDPAQFHAIDVGSYRFRFNAAGTATFDYDLEGRVGSLSLQRVAGF